MKKQLMKNLLATELDSTKLQHLKGGNDAGEDIIQDGATNDKYGSGGPPPPQ